MERKKLLIMLAWTLFFSATVFRSQMPAETTDSTGIGQGVLLAQADVVSDTSAAVQDTTVQALSDTTTSPQVPTTELKTQVTTTDTSTAVVETTAVAKKVVLPPEGLKGEVQGEWTPENGPYLIGGDLTIPAGQTLSIQPGTEVKFLGYYKLIVKGTLTAIGSDSAFVTFTSGKPQPQFGDWRSISLQGNSANASFKNTLIQFPDYGIEGNKVGSLTVESSEIRDCRYGGVSLRGTTGRITIQGNKIVRSSYGIISKEGASPIISADMLVDNSSVGIHCENSSPTIDKCTIIGSLVAGLNCLSSSNPSISKSILTKNGIAINSVNSSPQIKDCSITNNVIGLVSSENSSPVVTGSNICKNQSYDIKNVTSKALSAQGNWWGEGILGDDPLKKVYDARTDSKSGAILSADRLRFPSLTAPGQPVVESLTLILNDGKDLEKGASEGDTLTLELKGTDADPYSVNYTSVTLKMSISDPLGRAVILTETDVNSGIFKKSMILSHKEATGKNRLKLAYGDRLTFNSEIDPSKTASVEFVSLPPIVKNFVIEGKKGKKWILTPTPKFIWKYNDPEMDPPAKYQIEVTTDNTWSQIDTWQTEVGGNDSSLVYAGKTLSPSQNYYVRLRANDGFSWGNWVATQFRINGVPSVPVPVNPPDGVVIKENRQPVLTVQNAVDLDGDKLTYRFETYYDSELKKRAVMSDSVRQIPEGKDGNTSWTSPREFLENTQYWWRARAKDGYTDGEWSKVSSFMINSTEEDISPFSLRSPAKDDTVTILRPVFNWEQTYDPDPGEVTTYTLTYGKDPNFAGAIQSPGLNVEQNEYTPTSDLDDNSTYYWKVEALTKSGKNRFSDQTDWSFFVNRFNDPPVISTLPPVVFNMNDAGRLDLSGYISDPDDPIASMKWTVSGAINVQVKITGNRVFFSAPKDWYGSEKLTFTAEDPHNGKASAMTVVTVNHPPNLNVLPPIVFDEGTVYGFNMSEYVTDPDDPIPSLRWSVSGNKAIKVEILGNKTTFYAPETWHGSERITFAVEDPKGGKDAGSVLVTADHPPTLKAFTPFVFNMNTEGRFPVAEYVTDPDDPVQSIKWSVAEGTKVKAKMSGSTVILSTPADWYGSDRLTFTIEDPYGRKDTGVASVIVNHPPILKPLPTVIFNMDGQKEFELSGYVSDPDNPVSTLRWSAVSGQNVKAEVVGSKVVFSASKGWYGSENLTSVVEDPNGGKALGPISVIVNHQPEFKSISPVVFREGDQTTLNLADYVTDPDDPVTSLRWSVFGAKKVIASINDGKVTLSGILNWYGSERLTFSAEDPKGGRAQVAVDVTINRPPRFKPFAPFVFNEDSKLTVDLTGYVVDPDDPVSSLKWAVSSAEHIKTELEDSKVTFSGPPLWYGSEKISFSVEDPQGGKAEIALNVTIKHVNHPPQLKSLPPVTFDENTSATVELKDYASDPDGDVLTWSALPGLHVKALVSPTGQAKISALTDWSGSEKVTVTVIDTYKAKASETIDVTVRHVNRPPKLKPIPAIVFNEGTEYKLDLSNYATDSDNPISSLTWTISGGTDVKAAIEGSKATLSPNAGWRGSEELTFTVQDPPGAKAETKVKVTVKPINHPVSINEVSPDSANQSLRTGESVTFKIEASDPDNDPIAYTWTVNGIPQRKATGPSLKYTAVSGTKLPVAVKVVVSDGQSQASHQWKVVIKASTTTPGIKRQSKTKPKG